MKKITLLLVMFLLGFAGYSQVPQIIENFDDPSVTAPTTPGPWTLPSGTWQIFDNGVGSTNWSLSNNNAQFPANTAPNAAFINRQNINQGSTSIDFLATPLVTVPVNPQLLFNTRTTVAGNNFTTFEIRMAPESANPTDPASYTTVLATWADDALVIPYNVYQEKVVDLAASLTPGTNVYLAFVKVYTQPAAGIDGERWLVDDVRFIEKCLDVDVESLTANALATSATLSWAAGTSPAWQVHVLAAADTFNPTNGTPITVTGTPSVVVNATTQPAPPAPVPFTPLTQYKYYVRSVCANSNSEWVGPFTFTTQALPPECGGNFVDAGGVSANYPASSNSVITICPEEGSGDQVTVTFTAFQTETGWDALYVFDGNSTSAPQIASANPAQNVPGGLAGGYWGNTIPGPFTSSAANGCLTFWFRSDTSVQQAGWTANVTCDPPPACPKPTAIVPSAVTATSATISWTNVGPGTSWEVLAVPCTSPAPTDATTGTLVPGPATTYTFTNLNSSTCYNFYVRANCTSTNNGMSTWAVSTSVTTLIAPPVCGGVFVDAGGPQNYPANSNTTWIICPTPGSGDLVTVTFTAFQTETGWDALYVYDGDSTSAPLIASANPAQNVPGGLPGGYWGNTIPGPFEATGATGCLTFVFRSDGSVQQAGWTANVTCAPPPTCPRPTAFSASNPTSETVVLNWTNNGPATSWEVFAIPCGGAAPTASTVGIPVPGPATTYTFTDLNSSTCYDFYVRANCTSTENGISVWTGPDSETTLVAPPECGGVFVDEGGPQNYPANSNTIWTICPEEGSGEYAIVTFTAFQTETNWDALYVFDGNSTSAPQIATTNPAANVPGGLAGGFWGNTIPGPFESTSIDGCLTFWFRSDGSVQQQGWTANVTCLPPPTCPRPNGLAANNITTGTATLTWNQPPNPDGFIASNWEIVVLPFGSAEPTGAGIPTGGTYNAIGLLPGTCYTYYVRAICSQTDSSEWAGPFNFCTRPLNDECSNAIEVPVNQDLLCTQTINGTIAGATGSTQANGCAGTANDDVWYTFTATADTHVISFGNVTPATGLNFGLYTGDDCDNLTQVSCTAGNSQIAGNLLVGETYYIRVYSTAAIATTTTFFLCVGTVPCDQAPSFCSTQPVTYQNATNVPSLGQIGCLFTTPNPAFFFLQVNSAGPLNYLLTQSTTAGGPANLDVDYVVWGPFPDNAAACAAIPANPLPQGGACPALHACSYSAAPTETLCLPNAQLCEVYVVMITNFANQAGFVSFTQTNSTNPGGGQTECYPDTTFNYSQVSYCQDAADPTPTLATGAISGGVYSSTEGLVIDPTTGTIDLSASTPGTYLVTSTYSISGEVTCANFTNVIRTRVVIITPVPTAAIAYSQATYCSSADVQVVAQTGNVGGTYSATPAGLFIDALSGTVVPNASTPGVYTVTYTIPASGGCAAFPTTTQIEILTAPNLFDPADVTACGQYELPVLTQGDYYYQQGGAGSVVPAGTIITQSQQVWIYASNGICTDEVDFMVNINQIPDIGTLPNVTACDSFTLGTPTVGHYYDTPGNTGTVLDGTTITAPSTTVYVYAADGICTAQGSFTVTIGDIVTDVLPDVTVCDVYVLPSLSANNHYWTGAGCTGTELLAGSEVTTTQVIYICSSQGTCVGNTEEFQVTVNHTPVLAPVTNLSGCTVTLPALTVGQYYTDPLGVGPITDLTFDEPGTYTVYVYAETGTSPNCPSANPSFTVTVDPNTVTLAFAQGCQGNAYVLTATPSGGSSDPAGYSYEWTAGATGGSIVSGGATATPTVSGAGLYSVTVTTPEGCTGTDSVAVEATNCMIQKGISANGDGVNDFFDLEGFGVSRLQIFNRYGAKVYERSDYTNQWRGQSDKGDELPDGTYYYVIERTGGEPTETGWIYINRKN